MQLPIHTPFRKLVLPVLLLCCFSVSAQWCGGGFTTYSSVAAITPTTTPQTYVKAYTSGKAHWWSFSATAGRPYNFDLLQSTFGGSDDPEMFIYDNVEASGTEIAYSDVGYLYYAESVIDDWVAPNTQTYYVVVTNGGCSNFLSSGSIRLRYSYCSPPASVGLPFSPTFSNQFYCDGWVPTTVTDGSGNITGSWIREVLGYATTGSPVSMEAFGAGDQAINTGSAQDIYLTSPQLNTTGVVNLSFSFRHSLWSSCKSPGCSGSDNFTISVESSTNNSSWTTRWSQACVACGSNCQIIASNTLRTISFNPSSSTTWLRFHINGVLFKVYGWYIDNASVLPVNIISFTGRGSGNGVLLNWQTASEQNNDYFTIEKSTDGKDWRAIGTVQGAGNSSTEKNYSFTDESAVSQYSILNTQIYYRLKQTDFNGAYEYFGPIAVPLSLRDDWNLLLTNPAQEVLKGTLQFDEDAPVSLQILDLGGRIVLQEEITATNGANLIDLDISALDKGLYFIRAFCRNKSIVNKFVKQ